MNHISRRRLLAAATGLLLGAAVPAFGQTGVPATPDGLKTVIAGIYEATQKGDKAKAEAMIRALVLPGHEAWFKRVFGDAKGAAVTAEYAGVLAKFDHSVGRLFVKVVADGRSDLQVLRFDKPGGNEAVGLQNDALTAMEDPQPLYSVRFIKPGERRGTHVYSFVHADGGFRLVGRMSAVKDEGPR